jgi:CRISPR-associated protein Csn2
VKLVHQNTDDPLILEDEKINVLEIHDHQLFASYVNSLVNNYMPGVAQPGVLVDDSDKEKNFKNSVYTVSDCASIDLNDRFISGELFKKILLFVQEDEEKRDLIERLNCNLQDEIGVCSTPFYSDTCFSLDWDVIKYCKAMGFVIDASSDDTLFDKAIRLLDVATDLFPERVLCFVNLKLFLTGVEYSEFSRKAIFNRLRVLLYETVPAPSVSEYENRLIIDESYLESIS